MRDRRFVAVHRGGMLSKEHHRELMIWACKCARHILRLYSGPFKSDLKIALATGIKWTKEGATVGDARKAAVRAISVANSCINPVDTAIARAVGHAVATAHMADHALGPALYALRALQTAGKAPGKERDWQNSQLPEGIREMVLSARQLKERSFRINDSEL